MELAGILGRILSSVRRRGLLTAARRGLATLFHSIFPRRDKPHPFDVQTGLDTGGLLGPEKLASGHPNDRQTTAYFGTQPSVFLGIMTFWNDELAATGRRIQDYTFVDIGCGKGRVLMLASEFPFRRIVGIELSPLLVRTAQDNLARWSHLPRACTEISVLHADVLEYTLPETPALLFLYHPFEGGLFELWVSALRKEIDSRSTPLYLVYLNPAHEALLGRLPTIRLLWSGEIPFSAAEAAVHRFGGTAERVSLYRLT